MIYQFDTDDPVAATGALLVYACWRSRNTSRFKVTPDVWGQIERFVKASAKRATSIPRFLEAFKPRVACETIHPRWMEVGIKGDLPAIRLSGGAFVVSGQAEADRPEQREFLTGVLSEVDHEAVIRLLYRETAWIVLLVRDRLERERPLEARYARLADEAAS